MGEEEANAWKQKGNEQLKAGNTEKAIEFFTKGIECHPSHAVCYSNRSAAYAQLGEWNNSLKDAEGAIQYRSEWPKGYSRKALALYQLNRYEGSIESYKKACSLDPSNEELKKSLRKAENALKASELNVLGEEKANKAKPAQALPFYTDAIGLDQKPLYYSNRSKAYSDLGRYDQAIGDADQVIKRRPTWTRGFQRRAEALSGKRMYEDALSVYAYALQLDPGNELLTKAFNATRHEDFLHKQREEQKKKAEPQGKSK